MSIKMTFNEAETYLWRQIDDGLVTDEKQELAYRTALEALEKIQRIEVEFKYLSNK